MESALLVILAPLTTAVVVGCFGHFLGRTLSHWLAVGGVLIAFVKACQLAQEVWLLPIAKTHVLFSWATFTHLTFDITVMLDPLSVTMAVVVTFVSLMVHIYTIGYMAEDPGYQRFFAYISLFTFAMLMLVFANNFLQVFFGWEGVGVVSYLLIGFWHHKPNAVYANLKAFLVNRLGDWGLLLAMALLFGLYGSLDFQVIFAKPPPVVLLPELNVSALECACLGLLIGAMGKSAQIPLHVWLPDSMEGPTPISALIHAATMVTAGVFLLARCSPLLEYAPLMRSITLSIGALTAFSIGVLALVQTDMKRIIAYSTISQLGYMVAAIGASAYSAALFHLVTHAFFKALLFLAAGSVILAAHHQQNIQKLGGLYRKLPITYLCMLLASLALMGVPGFSGFFSKDMILMQVHQSTLPGAQFAYIALLAGVFVTAWYSVKLLAVVFHGETKLPDQEFLALKEPSFVVVSPLVMLTVPSVCLGMIALPYVQPWLASSLKVLPLHHGELVFTRIAMLAHSCQSPPSYLMVAGALTALGAHLWYPKSTIYGKRCLAWLLPILQYKYGFDALHQYALVPGVRGLGWLCWRLGDVFFIDGVCVNGSAKLVARCASVVRKIQSGSLHHYAFLLVFGLLGLVIWVLNKVG